MQLEVDFEYFDSNGASYRYDSGPLHQSFDARGGRTITPNYDENTEHVNRNGARGRYFKTGYTCAHLVDGPTDGLPHALTSFPAESAVCAVSLANGWAGPYRRGNPR